MLLTPGSWQLPQPVHACNAYCAGNEHATVIELLGPIDGPLNDADVVKLKNEVAR